MLYADHQGYVTCYTCDTRIEWQQSDCGHFIRRQHSSVRFHEDNCRPQCIECNRNNDGMEESFEEHLRDDLGDEAVDELFELGRSEKQYDENEYRELIHHYTLEIERKGGKVK
jgi:hypothetical protein